MDIVTKRRSLLESDSFVARVVVPGVMPKSGRTVVPTYI